MFLSSYQSLSTRIGKLLISKFFVYMISYLKRKIIYTLLIYSYVVKLYNNSILDVIINSYGIFKYIARTFLETVKEFTKLSMWLGSVSSPLCV